MKEQLHTIPVNNGFDAGDECPFCFMEREAERRIIRHVLGPGASYMEPDMRAATDAAGFCGVHMKKLYDYGNPLGMALMMQTYYTGILRELRSGVEEFQAPKRKLFGPAPEEPELARWASERTGRCYVCQRLEDTMGRYIKTFFALLKEPEFRGKFENSKGFCMRHFAMVLSAAGKELPKGQEEWFYPRLFSLMEENLTRVQGDIEWFTAKFDYRNAGADWKNSKDAVSRGIQKLQGLYPADPPYKKD